MKDLKDKDHVTIQSWMRTDLNLKGNDLIIYAIIHNFSKDGKSEFYGGLQYLADWCGCTKQGALKNLKNLVESELIIKTESERNGVKYCSYKVNTVKLSLTPLNSVERPVKHSLINNIDNNKKENNTIINNSIRKTGKNLYQKCSDEIQAFNFSKKLQDLLYDYLSIRLKIADKPIYNVRQWTAILKKLTEELAPNDEAMQIDIVKQSIERGYASFFPVNDKQKKQTHKRVDKGVSCEQYTKEELQNIKKYQKEVVKNGGRIKF